MVPFAILHGLVALQLKRDPRRDCNVDNLPLNLRGVHEVIGLRFRVPLNPEPLKLEPNLHL